MKQGESAPAPEQILGRGAAARVGVRSSKQPRERFNFSHRYERSYETISKLGFPHGSSTDSKGMITLGRLNCLKKLYELTAEPAYLQPRDITVGTFGTSDSAAGRRARNQQCGPWDPGGVRLRPEGVIRAVGQHALQGRYVRSHATGMRKHVRPLYSARRTIHHVYRSTSACIFHHESTCYCLILPTASLEAVWLSNLPGGGISEPPATRKINYTDTRPKYSAKGCAETPIGQVSTCLAKLAGCSTVGAHGGGGRGGGLRVRRLVPQAWFGCGSKSRLGSTNDPRQ